jgi:hypothetical protein
VMMERLAEAGAALVIADNKEDKAREARVEIENGIVSLFRPTSPLPLHGGVQIPANVPRGLSQSFGNG